MSYTVTCVECGHDPSWHRVSSYNQPDPCLYTGCECRDYVPQPELKPSHLSAVNVGVISISYRVAIDGDMITGVEVEGGPSTSNSARASRAGKRHTTEESRR